MRGNTRFTETYSVSAFQRLMIQCGSRTGKVVPANVSDATYDGYVPEVPWKVPLILMLPKKETGSSLS